MQRDHHTSVSFETSALWAGELLGDAIEDALELRRAVFRSGKNDQTDTDKFDATARHFGVRDTGTGNLVCAYRVLCHSGPQVLHGYCGARYDLSNLAAQNWTILELGRFCISPTVASADVLRLAWAILTKYVDESRADALIGSSSFDGVDTSVNMSILSTLANKFAAPRNLAPLKMPNQPVIDIDAKSESFALADLPPLVRSYLAMNAWFSDHCVQDFDLNTHHLFTCVEIDKIPETRARLLRRAAALVDHGRPTA